MKRIHYLLLGLLVSLTIAATGPGLPPTRIAPGANTTVVTNGINSFTIASAGGGSGAQLAGTNIFTGTNQFNEPIEAVSGVVYAGLAWTARTEAAANQWKSVIYGNGMFVAVSINGTGNRVMTSPDGVAWTSRTSAADLEWQSVTYGNGLFVAVAASGTGNRVMTSPDGITWTSRTSAADNLWISITYGNGLFVAVSISGTGNRVMTSPDGVTWTSRTSAADLSYYSVTYGNGLFVAPAYSSTSLMTSPDGINWTIRTGASASGWIGISYGNGVFVNVALTGTGQVQTSGKTESQPFSANNLLQGNWEYRGSVTALSLKDTSGNQVVTNQQGAVADASGGVVIDAEARTALNSLLAKLRTHGLISP